MKPLQTSWKIVKKVFKYLEPLWTGADGRISVRSCLAIYFSWKLIENLDYGIRKWGADRSLVGLDSNLIILAGLIAALLGLSTWQNMTDKKTESQAANPPPAPITIQKAETVTVPTTNTTAETVNTKNVETLNSTNTNVSSKKDEEELLDI